MSPVKNVDGIFCDGLISHYERCIFISLWGRASDVLALYGGITIDLISLLQIDSDYSVRVHKNLQKTQMRMPKDSRYDNDLVHIMLYESAVTTAEDNHRYLIGKKPIESERIWSAIVELSDIGLLLHWQNPILKKLQESKMIIELEAKEDNSLHGIYVELEQNAFTNMISTMLQSGELTE